MSYSTNRALFLDRDGVINYDAGHTSNIEKFHFIEGIFELCIAAKKLGYLLIVVTNQAGIGRGYYSEQVFLDLTEWMCQRFIEQGVAIDDVFYCPYHPEYGVGIYKKESFDRKPSPGMILNAVEKHGINLSSSILIGDKDSDMQAAQKASVAIRCLYIPEGSNQMSKESTHKISSLIEAIPLLTSHVNEVFK